MIYRPLGKAGFDISAIALGCWAMGGALWGDQDDDASVTTIRHAIDIGVTTLDTAPVYGSGRSERVVGKALEGIRDKVVLATKWGVYRDPAGEIERSSTPNRLEFEIETSLQRLQTDHIDLYQVHAPDDRTPIADTATAMNRYCEDGTIRAIGVSNYTVEQVKEWLDNAPLHCLQPPFSMFRRETANDLLPFCMEHDIATIVYSPLHMGLLTGKFDRNSEFSDLRATHEDFSGQRFEINLDTIDELCEIADRLDCSMTQLAVAWTIHQPGVTAAICGARQPEQIDDSAGGADVELSDGVMDEINQILQTRDKRIANL